MLHGIYFLKRVHYKMKMSYSSLILIPVTMLFISEIYKQLMSLRFKLPVSFTVAVSNMKTKNSVLNVIYCTKTGEVKVKSCDAQFTRFISGIKSSNEILLYDMNIINITCIDIIIQVNI